jgi:hypothetical protein
MARNYADIFPRILNVFESRRVLRWVLTLRTRHEWVNHFVYVGSGV